MSDVTVLYEPEPPEWERRMEAYPTVSARAYRVGTVIETNGRKWECYFDEQDRQNQWREVTRAGQGDES